VLLLRPATRLAPAQAGVHALACVTISAFYCLTPLPLFCPSIRINLIAIHARLIHPGALLLWYFLQFFQKIFALFLVAFVVEGRLPRLRGDKLFARNSQFLERATKSHFAHIIFPFFFHLFERAIRIRLHEFCKSVHVLNF
jgi:hypothetical protein